MNVKDIHQLRIEMQIFSLHWMMQNIRLFNVCEARRASRRHLNANVLNKIFHFSRITSEFGGVGTASERKSCT